MGDIKASEGIDDHQVPMEPADIENPETILFSDIPRFIFGMTMQLGSDFVNRANSTKVDILNAIGADYD